MTSTTTLRVLLWSLSRLAMCPSSSLGEVLRAVLPVFEADCLLLSESTIALSITDPHSDFHGREFGEFVCLANSSAFQLPGISFCYHVEIFVIAVHRFRVHHESWTLAIRNNGNASLGDVSISKNSQRSLYCQNLLPKSATVVWQVYRLHYSDRFRKNLTANSSVQFWTVSLNLHVVFYEVWCAPFFQTSLSGIHVLNLFVLRYHAVTVPDNPHIL